MNFSIRTLALAAAVMLSAAAMAFEWKFNDGGNFKRVKESNNPALNAQINFHQFTKWAFEDDRGWFLTVQEGGRLYVPHSPELEFNDGFYLSCRFMIDLSKVGKQQFANLVTKGDNFNQGYSIMIHRNGNLLLDLRGINPEYSLRKNVKFKTMREYKLEIFAGNGEVVIYVDGTEVDRYAYTGKFNFTNGKPLRIAQYGGFHFNGNLYYLMLEKYRTPTKKAAPAVKKKKRIVPDNPAGTVWVNDFLLFNEKNKMQVVTGPGLEKSWGIRKAGFFGKDGIQVLHPPKDINVGPISCQPKLQGEYDVYIGMRVTGAVGSIKFSLGDENSTMIIRTAVADGNNHFNCEIPLLKKFRMDGRTLTISPTGENAYVGYVKFVPAGKRKTEPEAEEKVQIFRGKEVEKFDKVLDAAIQQQINNGYFRERLYVDNQALPKISDTSAGRGFIISVDDYMQLTFKNTIPAQDNTNPKVTAKLAKGEFENAAFSIFALKNLNKAAISWKTPFPKGISAELFTVESLPKRVNSWAGGGEFINAPQYLEPFVPAGIPAKNNLSCQLLLHADKNIAAGIYRAELEIDCDGKKALLPLEVTVRNFALDPIVNYDLTFWISFDGKSEAEIAREIKSLAEHNMTSLVIMDSIAFKTVNGKTAIDWERSTLPIAAKYMKQYGMSGKLHIGTSTINTFAKENYSEVVASIETYAKAHNWPERVYTCFDEVSSHPEQFPALTARLRDLKNLGLTTHVDHIYYKTTRPIQKEIDGMSGLVDIFILRYNTRGIFYADRWDEIQKTIAAKGKTLLAYNSNNGITFTQSAMMRFGNGWFFRSFGSGTKGHITWAWNWYTNNPYTDLDGTVDWVYIYPPRGSRRGGNSLNYELMREGIDDLRYIITLENLIAKAAKQNLAAEAKEAGTLIKTLANSFDRKNFEAKSVFFDSKFEQYGTLPNGKLFCSGDYLLPNGWKNQDYHTAREKIAAMIEKLGKKVR